MAPPADLRTWISLLQREGELVRIAAEVDPELEITEITDRTVKAGGRRALHHAPRRDHTRPPRRDAQRRHVPHAEARSALDRHALADPQGRPRGLSRHRRQDRGRRRARTRPGDDLLRERAAPEAR